MRKMMSKLLRKYGIWATVHHGYRDWRVKIFFQPSGSKSWQSMEPIVTPLGQLPGGQYLYIGPAELEISAGDPVTVGDETYFLRRAEVYRDDRGPVYRWGLCVRKGGEDTWGSQA